MIDLEMLRERPEDLARAWRARGETVDVSALVELDAEVRRLKHASESTRAEAKQASNAIGVAAKRGEDVDAAKAEARRLSDRAKELDRDRVAREEELRERLMHLPNVCPPSVPEGADESDNVVREEHGAVPEFAFEPRPHWELAEELGIIDFERGARLAGSGFAVFAGAGARLQRALVAWFLDRHRAAGYRELAVPLLVRPEIMAGTGQLPKFAEDAYRCERDELYLISTAEVPVTNLHGGEILDAELLPIRYCCHSQCFRREAGAAGVGTRGITRVHQFEKVELVWLTTPERGEEDLLSLRSHAEALLRDLGLRYRVLELCTADTGFSAARTYDLEVWSPGTGGWLEVSSCSTFTDFQARRANLRYRDPGTGRPRLLHTLNGSALALPRCIIALLEQGQRDDGAVVVPEVLRPYLDGLECIQAGA